MRLVYVSFSSARLTVVGTLTRFLAGMGVLLGLRSGCTCYESTRVTTLGLEDTCVVHEEHRTQVQRPSGRMLELRGRWELATEVVGDRALLYRDERSVTRGDHERMSLDAASREPRVVHRANYRRSAGLWDASAWSADRKTLYEWIDVDEQLCSIDVETGDRRSLTSFPTRLASYKTVHDQEFGGFAVLDVDTGEIVASSERGYSVAWSPDGRSIAYRDVYELWVYDVASRSATLLARQEGQEPEDEPPAGLGIPAWSHDGRWLASGIGGYVWKDPGFHGPRDDPTVLLDLHDRRVVILPVTAGAMTWATHSRPFDPE